jgi:predicted amidohydrolase
VTTTIACGQLAAEPGNLRRNAELMVGMAGQAARAGAEIVVFPELALCGYCTPEQAAASAVEPSGAALEPLRDAAREHGQVIAAGFAERRPGGRAGGSLANSMACFGPDGALLSVYRKVHLWVTERAWAVPGTGFDAFDAAGTRAGLWICYDTRFPETARTLARAGAVLGLVGSAWFGPPAEWELALRSRSLDNGIFTAGATLLGSFGQAPFRGESMIVDPHGTVLARAEPGREGVITASCDLSAVDRFRARLPLLDDLRPAAYG